MNIEQIDEKREEIQKYNVLSQDAGRELQNMKMEYIKEKYDVELRTLFNDDEKPRAVEHISVYMSYEPSDIFLSCSRILKSGKWSVKTETYTLQDFLDLKDKR